MTETRLSVGEDMLTVPLPGGLAAFPLIWLRHNCPSALHPHTRERVEHLLDIPARPMLRRAALEGQTVVLDWANGHQSRFDTGWLAAHRPGATQSDPAAVTRQPWPVGFAPGDVPRFSAADVLHHDPVLLQWLTETRRHGLSIIQGLDARIEAGVEVAERIAFLRETNFGRTFEVKSKPNPNNLAYTADALPLHTDLPNQEMPPGFQFLHCIANDADGGQSVVADGLAVAETLQAQNPDAFERLCETRVPFRFHDEVSDLRACRPIIERDASGEVTELRYNLHILAVPDMAADQMVAWYGALRALAELVEAEETSIRVKLRAGEMLVFDNRRVLHGRAAFNPSTGHRHLHGCYVDRGDFDSRLRVLSRAVHAEAVP